MSIVLSSRQKLHCPLRCDSPPLRIFTCISTKRISLIAIRITVAIRVLCLARCGGWRFRLGCSALNYLAGAMLNVKGL
jgi:hypothetical protein